MLIIIVARYKKSADALRPTTCTEITLALAEVSVDQQSTEWQARQVAESLSLFDYRADKLKSKPAELSLQLKKVVFGATKAQTADATKGLQLGQAIAKGVNLARDIGRFARQYLYSNLSCQRSQTPNGQAAKTERQYPRRKAIERVGHGLLSVGCCRQRSTS